MFIEHITLSKTDQPAKQLYRPSQLRLTNQTKLTCSLVRAGRASTMIAVHKQSGIAANNGFTWSKGNLTFRRVIFFDILTKVLTLFTSQKKLLYVS